MRIISKIQQNAYYAYTIALKYDLFIIHKSRISFDIFTTVDL